jgi:hypothetical protein
MRLPFFYGWVVVAVAFVTMAVGVNARTAFSLLFPPILAEFGWERGVTAGAFSFGFLVSAILSPSLGRMMDWKGPRAGPVAPHLTLGVFVGGQLAPYGTILCRTGSCARAAWRSASRSPASAWARS